MLQEIRKQKGLSQKKLGELSNVNYRTIQFYEQGLKDINGARLKTLLDLSIVLDCKVSQLLTDEELKEKCKKARL